MSSMTADGLIKAADEIYDGILKIVESSIATKKGPGDAAQGSPEENK